MRTFCAALAVLAVGWGVLGLGLLAEARRGGPEAAIRGYLADLEGRRVEDALAALSPDSRARWRDFLEFQQFNRYEVVSIATRSPSLLDVIVRGEPWTATQATLIADITEPSGNRWRGSTVIRLEPVGQGWLFDRPPFASD